MRKEPESMLIICEYLDVFFEEMNGLTPKREIEFTIEVVPGTTPISQTPFRMALHELKGVKKLIAEIAR